MKILIGIVCSLMAASLLILLSYISQERETHILYDKINQRLGEFNQLLNEHSFKNSFEKSSYVKDLEDFTRGVELYKLQKFGKNNSLHLYLVGLTLVVSLIYLGLAVILFRNMYLPRWVFIIGASIVGIWIIYLGLYFMDLTESLTFLSKSVMKLRYDIGLEGVNYYKQVIVGRSKIEQTFLIVWSSVIVVYMSIPLLLSIKRISYKR